MKKSEKNGYLRFSDKTKKIKEVKDELGLAGFPIDAVNEKLMRHFASHLRAVGADLPDDTLLVVAPSTTGSNPIPELMAQHIQQGAQGKLEILDSRALLPKNEEKAAHKGGLAKLADPIVIEANGDFLPNNRRRPVVIIDDVVTTGETTDAIRLALAPHNIKASGVLTLGMAEQRTTSKRDLERLTEKLGDPTMKETVDLLFGGRLKHKLNYVERIASRHTDHSDSSIPKDERQLEPKANHDRRLAKLRPLLANAARRNAALSATERRGMRSLPGIPSRRELER